MDFVRALAGCIVETTNLFGIRSSKRTDAIHSMLKTYIETRNPRVSCTVEYKLATLLGGFDVDIAVFEKDTPHLLACLLFKGLTSSIAKNSKNYEHNKIGEAVKAKSGMGSARLLFLDVVPIRCPTYGTDDAIKCWETHTPESIRARSELLKRVINEGRERPIIDDIYTICVDYAYQPNRKIELTSVIDDADMARMNAFIDSLAPAVSADSSLLC